jgi:hypothetical protein
VAQRADREGVVVDVGGVAEHPLDEVAALDVVHQVGEEMAPEGVVAEILHDGSAVGVSARVEQRLRRRTGILREQQRPDLRLPQRVDVRLVREDGIRLGGRRHQEQQRDNNGDGAQPCHRAAPVVALSAALKITLSVPNGCPRHSGRNPSRMTRPDPSWTSSAAAFPASSFSPIT